MLSFPHIPPLTRMLKVYDIADGLGYLHSRAPLVVHGDLHLVSILEV